MSDHPVAPAGRPAATPSCWPGLLSIIAGYLFGLAAVIISKTASGSTQQVLLKAAPCFALTVVFCVLGAIKLKRVMNCPGAAASRRRIPWWAAVAAVIIAAGLPILAGVLLPSRWRPQLDVRNTGTKAVTFSVDGRSYETAPGEVWHTRFSAGQTVTVRASGVPETAARTIPLPKDDPMPWSFHPIVQRYTADVNADDPANLRLENFNFEEISSPPPPPRAWPK